MTVIRARHTLASSSGHVRTFWNTSPLASAMALRADNAAAAFHALVSGMHTSKANFRDAANVTPSLDLHENKLLKTGPTKGIHSALRTWTSAANRLYILMSDTP
jgi:hypothetical protein